MFALFMRYTLVFRYTLALVLACVIYVLISLPSEAERSSSVDDDFQALPDVDLAATAEELWAEQRKESALNILAYAIKYGQQDLSAHIPSGLANNLPLCAALEEDYLLALNSDKSLDGRLWKIGKGAVTGEIDSWEEMAGSTVADLFVVGDIRDLFMQSFIVDETDALIVSLSTLGILTTVWPPADPAISLLKAARKGQHISEPIVKQLSTAAQAYKKSPGTKTQAAFLDAVKPIWELSGKCTSWSQMTLLLKHCDSIDSIAKINKILGKSVQNSQKLGSIISVCSRRSKLFHKTLQQIHHHGQKGMDALYKLTRKGPAGFSFIGKHPKFFLRAGKISYKSGDFVYQDLLRRYQHYMNTLRYLGILSASLLICILTPLRHLLLRLYHFKFFKHIHRLPKRISLPIGFLLSASIIFMLSAPATNHLPHSAKQPAVGIHSIQKIIREIRIDMQEVDDFDVDDSLHHLHHAPIVRASDGSQWIIAYAPNLALNWPEIFDGDINHLRFICSKRGSNPHSIHYQDAIFVYQAKKILCAIKLPKEAHSPDAQAPLNTETLSQNPPLFIIKGNNAGKGYQLSQYSSNKRSIHFNANSIPQHARPQAGDYLVDQNGALAGIVDKENLSHGLNEHFFKIMKATIDIHSTDADNYFHQFVSDIKAYQAK
ncbi:MAG: hypothetical protein HRU15_03340 [Planctomycetes bacterium]|nr:hypothetical protein [Planctomycetota bacterium]